jgi:glycosyltransferase involved in cell wall biosynthesis
MAQIRILEQHGHDVSRFLRSSTGLDRTLLGKVRAFFSGIYSPASRREIARIVRTHAPDVAHVHNLFPWISPAILPVLRAAGIPVVMTVHNYRLVCPSGLHMPKGQNGVCEKCCGGTRVLVCTEEL